MNIGLIDIEPKVVNTALMQISMYHKQRGDIVEWATPLTYHCYDKLYCSSLFDFTDKSQLPKRTICGGTGFDLTTNLPTEIEECEYDYSIYPDCDYSIVWFSRGCIRRCPFCVVWKKEGKIRPVKQKPLNPIGKYIVVQDNNFFANPEWLKAWSYLAVANESLPLDFQGIDARIITDDQSIRLSELRHYKQIKIAWDSYDYETYVGIKRMLKYIPPYKIMCYVLIGYNSNHWSNYSRVMALRAMDVDPFVMPYNKKDPYQKDFARWVNHKAVFKSVKWEEYKKF